MVFTSASTFRISEKYKTKMTKIDVENKNSKNIPIPIIDTQNEFGCRYVLDYFEYGNLVTLNPTGYTLNVTIVHLLLIISIDDLAPSVQTTIIGKLNSFIFAMVFQSITFLLH